ncbi:hypothetical protein K439DRAFT_1626864 [Ramaria rubella]|nr:hypothetical protein K439DRAFT_1626864 [Ramaria rubella]
MSLFEVKGWEVPSQTTLSRPYPPKKRKRPAIDGERVQSAQLNVEKLIQKVDKGSRFELRNRLKMRRKDKHRSQFSPGRETFDRTESEDNPCLKPQSHDEILHEDNPESGSTSKEPKFRPSKRTKGIESAVLSPPLTQQPASDHAPFPKKAKTNMEPFKGLTSLQASMKGSLDGARFRWINEVLYTTDSVEGHRLMREDPNLYAEYHMGFRQQVRTWPSNPVNHYASVLSSYPRGTVIADLGCGDAALARTLVPKGYCVLSFDLVPDNEYVLEADVCKRIPLPGKEDLEDESHAQIVDVCVCALSLMSLDWIQCIRETWRILRLGGELKIAEVTSRFTDLDQFIAVINGLGFKLKSKDDSNTHFTLFEFRKITRPPLSNKRWNELRTKYSILKPCEYKRR